MRERFIRAEKGYVFVLRGPQLGVPNTVAHYAGHFGSDALASLSAYPCRLLLEHR
jgi:hypothetical protein